MDNKRFWVLDELIKIGHLEAAMSHSDEQICNVNHDQEQNGTDIKKLEELAKEGDYHRELIALDYENRTGCENDLMDMMKGNSKDWCYLKHHATAFVIAAENYHARGCDPCAERSLILSGKALALCVSHCFGFEAMDCLRCLGESLASKYGKDTNVLSPSVQVAKTDVNTSPTSPSMTVYPITV